MAKVTVEFLDLKVTIEDKETPYHTLLNTASEEILHLVDNASVKTVMNKIFAKHDLDGGEEAAEIPIKNTDRGMFA
jgi:hypothetical protein